MGKKNRKRPSTFEERPNTFEESNDPREACPAGVIQKRRQHVHTSKQIMIQIIQFLNCRSERLCRIRIVQMCQIMQLKRLLSGNMSYCRSHKIGNRFVLPYLADLHHEERIDVCPRRENVAMLILWILMITPGNTYRLRRQRKTCGADILKVYEDYHPA